MNELLANPVVTLSLFAWLIVQTAKFIGNRRRDSQAKFSDSGGMPSSHAAVIGAATTVIGLADGVESSLFGLAVVVMAIVVHDAFRLRWAVGEQAARLNLITQQEHLKNVPPVVVWRGHRLREVAVGLGLGSALAAVGYLVVY